VPKALIQPNLSILAEVDPANAIAEANEADNAFRPRARRRHGRARHVGVQRAVRPGPPERERAAGQRHQRESATASRRDDEASPAGELRRRPARAVHHQRPAVASDNGNNAWTTILSELDALHTADGSPRYYFGVINPTYSSGVAGIGYVGGKTALGWDKNGADQVAAHEWGHNWGRQHAPCGGAANPDVNYPYAGGSIGVYGFDVAAQSLKPPTSSDLMGYCSNEWISDYTYAGVLNYRSAHPDVMASFAQAMQPCLLVWGRIVDGQPVLEPAFQVTTRPSLPSRGGPYSVEGRAADGTRLFHLSFTAEQVADDPRGGEHFAFAVPLAADRAARLDALGLSVPGRPVVSLARRPARCPGRARRPHHLASGPAAWRCAGHDGPPDGDGSGSHHGQVPRSPAAGGARWPPIATISTPAC
jgi:hypothetical protein